MKTFSENKHELSRRSLLKTFVASGISKSLISSSSLVSGILFARHADAQITSGPTKAFTIYVPGGGIHDYWAPTGSGSSMVLPKMSMGYESVKTECNFLRNMSHESAGHGRQPKILSPSFSGSGTDSYDVFMGKQLGPDLPFTYANFGVHSNGNGYLTREGNTTIPFQDNPFTAFRLLFGSNVSSSSKTPILDSHAEAANAIKSKLAGYEVDRMDEHLDAISDTQRRLDDLSGGGSSCSAAPDDTEFALTHETFTQQAKLQADIAVAALKCNITSSVSLAFGNNQCEFSIPELNYTGNYHQSIHGGGGGRAGYPHYTELRNHLGSLTAYAIGKLRDEGILDDTIVVETTDMGAADSHSGSDVPFMLAGGGSVLNRGVTTPVGAAYNQLDVIYTAARACGVTLPYGQEIPGLLTS